MKPRLRTCWLRSFAQLLLLACFVWAGLPAFSFAAIVSGVFDGDTIVLADGTKVRYLGINTPERDQPFYEEAKRYNRQLVLRKDVRVETAGRKRDGYGRLLAYVYVGDTLVNEQLIAAGWAHVFMIETLEHATRWLGVQKQAQAQRKGMWKDGSLGPLKITSVKADAGGEDRRNVNGEYVRVCNVSNGPVNLRGFSLQDAAGHRYQFPDSTLAPGYTALVHSGRGRHTIRRNQLILYWGSPRPIWNNDKDTASLFDPDGRLIDTFHIRPYERNGQQRQRSP